jgi:hypothetical protein
MVIPYFFHWSGIVRLLEPYSWIVWKKYQKTLGCQCLQDACRTTPSYERVSTVGTASCAVPDTLASGFKKSQYILVPQVPILTIYLQSPLATCLAHALVEVCRMANLVEMSWRMTWAARKEPWFSSAGFRHGNVTNPSPKLMVKISGALKTWLVVQICP